MPATPAAAPPHEIDTTALLHDVMRTVGDSTHDTHAAYEMWAGRWARTMHRRLMAEGLDDQDAARLTRMMRDELNRLSQTAIAHAQQMHAVADAVSLVHDEVNRTRRLNHRSGTSGLNMGAA